MFIYSFKKIRFLKKHKYLFKFVNQYFYFKPEKLPSLKFPEVPLIAKLRLT